MTETDMLHREDRRPARVPLRNVLFWLASVLALTACTDPGERATGTDSIHGTVSYRERIALPPESMVTVELQDVSRADAPAITIASTTLPATGGPPYAFELTYDTAAIDERMRYALRAKIVHDGDLLFTTDTHYPAFADDAPELRVIRVARRATPGLTGVDWMLVRLGDLEDPQGVDDRPPTIRFAAGEDRVHGFAGCNRFTGTYETVDGTLALSPLASTRMACVEGMETEARFLAALENVAGYRLVDGDLTLQDTAGRTLALLRRRPDTD